MMQQMNFINRNALQYQRGMTLIESLVAAVLLGVIFLGLTYALSRAMVSQRYNVTQSTFLQETRENLQTVGIQRLCDAGEAPASYNWLPVAVQVSKSCSDSTVTVDIPGLQRDVVTHKLSLVTNDNDDNQQLFGGNGEVLFGER